MYRWKPGIRYRINAQVAGERLEQLREQYGGIRAEVVVEEARSPDDPLHPAFTWDDDKAAEEYRKDEARKMIRSIVVLNPCENDEEQRPIRAFIVINDSNDGAVYTSTVHALQDKDQRRQVLERALWEMEAFQRKYQEFEELAEAMEAATIARDRIRQRLKSSPSSV